jgi:hypothetical protein
MGGEPLELMAAQIGGLEQAADQPTRAPADYHAARRGNILQPGGEGGRLADHRLLPRRALAEQVATTSGPVAIPARAASGVPTGPPPP